MHITVTSATGDAVFPLEIPDDLGVADFKAFCEAQSDIPSAEMAILFNGRSMDDDKKKVSDYGLKDGEMVVLERRRKAKPKSSNPAAAGGLQLPGTPQTDYKVTGYKVKSLIGAISKPQYTLAE